jgi:hypothetical protein
MTHSFILLDQKLKFLARQRRWKEYNTMCSLRCNNQLSSKVDLNKMRSWLLKDEKFLDNKINTCAVCLNKNGCCIVSI